MPWQPTGRTNHHSLPSRTRSPGPIGDRRARCAAPVDPPRSPGACSSLRLRWLHEGLRRARGRRRKRRTARMARPRRCHTRTRSMSSSPIAYWRLSDPPPEAILRRTRSACRPRATIRARIRATVTLGQAPGLNLSDPNATATPPSTRPGFVEVAHDAKPSRCHSSPSRRSCIRTVS